MNGDFTPRTDTFAQQENDHNIEEEVIDDYEYEGEQAEVFDTESNATVGHTPATIDLMSDDDINELICTLNEK